MGSHVSPQPQASWWCHLPRRNPREVFRGWAPGSGRRWCGGRDELPRAPGLPSFTHSFGFSHKPNPLTPCLQPTFQWNLGSHPKTLKSDWGKKKSPKRQALQILKPPIKCSVGTYLPSAGPERSTSSPAWGQEAVSVSSAEVGVKTGVWGPYCEESPRMRPKGR